MSNSQICDCLECWKLVNAALIKLFFPPLSSLIHQFRQFCHSYLQLILFSFSQTRLCRPSSRFLSFFAKWHIHCDPWKTSYKQKSEAVRWRLAAVRRVNMTWDSKKNRDSRAGRSECLDLTCRSLLMLGDKQMMCSHVDPAFSPRGEPGNLWRIIIVGMCLFLYC